MNLETTPLLIAIDDEKFYLDEIGYELDGQNVEYLRFQGPNAFETEAQEADLNRASLIIVDYDFRTCTAVDRDLAGFIRDKFPGFKGKIVLLSLLDDFFQDNEAVKRSFDAVLDKRSDLAWERIQTYLN